VGVGVSEEVFQTRVGPLLPLARAVARKTLADPALAEDAVQEALLRAYRFWSAHRGDDVWPWLRRMVIRECFRAAARDQARRRPGPSGVPPESPAEALERREEREAVRMLLDRLPAGYRRVVVLRHGRGLTEAGTAAVLGLPLGTVKWRHHRALRYLRLALTGTARPLAGTLREVVPAMRFSVSAGPWRDPSHSVPVAAREARAPVSFARARAAVPGFDLPEQWVDRHTGEVWLLADEGRTPHGVCVRTLRFRVTYTHLLGARGAHFHSLEGGAVLVDEPTVIGGGPGRWWQIGAEHTVCWSSGHGHVWQVSGAVDPAELRGAAEEVAALVGVAGPEEEPERAPAPPPSPVSLAAARAAVLGFGVPEAFLAAHSAVLYLETVEEGEAPSGVLVHARCFDALYRSPDGHARYRYPAPWTPVERRPVRNHADAVSWEDRGLRCLAWPTDKGGQWAVMLAADSKRLQEIAAALAEAVDAEGP
jgi:RNA polymerase sigma-70 factor (ECF subfamily)